MIGICVVLPECPLDGNQVIGVSLVSSEVCVMGCPPLSVLQVAPQPGVELSHKASIQSRPW